MARTPMRLPFDGNILREKRERRGWTQKDLAERCTEQGTPVSRFQVVRAETGRYKPIPSTLKAFAKALDVEIDDLLAPASAPAAPQRRAS